MEQTTVAVQNAIADHAFPPPDADTVTPEQHLPKRSGSISTPIGCV